MGLLNPPPPSPIEALDLALHPWMQAPGHAWEQGLVRGLSDQDVALADKSVKMLEESTVAEMSETTVNKLSDLLYELAVMPASRAPAKLPALRARLANVQSQIYQHVLQDELANAVGASAGESAEKQATSLLAGWSEVIDTHMLSKGVKEKNISHSKVARVLTHLETWSDVSFAALKDSGMIEKLAAVVKAPCIPVMRRAGNFRTRAYELLRGWRTLPAAQALDYGVFTPVLEPDTEESAHTSYFDVDEAAQVLRDLEVQAASGDFNGVVLCLDTIESWADVPFKLTQEFYSVIGLVKENLGKASVVPSSERRTAFRRLEAFAPINQRNAVSPSELISLSYSPATSKEHSIMKIRFKHAAHVLGPWEHDAYSVRPDPSTWDDVVVNAHLDIPLQRIFDEFTATANGRHRHPLAPHSHFKFALVDASLKDDSLTEGVWDLDITQFTQGRVAHLGIGNITQEAIIYYIMGGFHNTHNLVTRLPEVQFRRLPKTCLAAPTSWARPAAPGKQEGPWHTWQEIATLAFVGNGVDVWPHTTYPPVIAAQVYTLTPPANAAFGLQSYDKPLQSHLSTPKDCTPEKLQPPLTETQARSLLGRTIQYEDIRALNPMAAPGSANVELPKKKKRRVEADGIDWTRVYTAVVWGFDPGRMELKVFAGWQLGETCRTLMVGELQEPQPRPWLFPEARLSFAPRWLGKVVLPLPEPQAEVDAKSEPEPETATPQAPQPDRLAEIMKLAPREFEVGIGGDRILLVGEISIHASNPTYIIKVDGCKLGIWSSGWNAAEDDPAILCWVLWVRTGTIDLTQPVDGFRNARRRQTRLSGGLSWSSMDVVSVDGGSVTIIAEAIAHPDSQVTLTGREAVDKDDFLRDLALSGWEDNLGHVPGGVSVNTGGDGGFEVEIARDDEGQVIAVRVKGMSDQ